jgi:hypothetical protein
MSRHLCGLRNLAARERAFGGDGVGQQELLAKRKLQLSERPLMKKVAVHGPLLEDG